MAGGRKVLWESWAACTIRLRRLRHGSQPACIPLCVWRNTEPVSTSIERRSSPRNSLLCPVEVCRPDEGMMDHGRIHTANSSREGVYLIAETHTFQQRVKLFLSFPHGANPNRNPELHHGLLRNDYLGSGASGFSPHGRCGVAARLLTRVFNSGCAMESSYPITHIGSSSGRFWNPVAQTSMLELTNTIRGERRAVTGMSPASN